MTHSNLTDTHCHLNHKSLYYNLAEHLQNAEQQGVNRMIVVGYDLPSSILAVELAQQYPGRIWASVGIHPTEAQNYCAQTEQELYRLAQLPCVAAVGEIGLDYYHKETSTSAQFTALAAQREMAAELKLPLILHCRNAYSDLLKAFSTAPASVYGGVMHCWGGTAREAAAAIKLGFSLGIGGVVTFSNALELQNLVQNSRLEDLLLETDAPYLAPMPYRGKRNEPAWVALVAEKVAQLKNITVEEVASCTSSSASRVFPRLSGSFSA